MMPTLQVRFRLGCHGLPVATGLWAGAGHVDRANRVATVGLLAMQGI